MTVASKDVSLLAELLLSMGSNQLRVSIGGEIFLFSFNGFLNCAPAMRLKNGSVTLGGSDYFYDDIDNSRRLRTVRDAIGNKTFVYAYKPETNWVSSLSSTGATTTTEYDSVGRVSHVRTLNAAGLPVFDQTLTYTSLDQIDTQTTARFDVLGSSSIQVLQFAYNSLRQLTSVTDITIPILPVVLESFQYDAMGNRTNGFTTDAAHLKLNQYTSYDTATGTLAVTYDARGNTTSDGRFTYTYDILDRMISAEAVDQSKKATYTYDAENRLISRTEFSNHVPILGYLTQETTNYAYDGMQIIAKLDGEGNVKQRYQWGIGMAGNIGALLSITDHSIPLLPQTYTPVYDTNGNIVQLLNETGIVVANYKYAAFGKLLSATGIAANVSPFGWQTMLHDSVTGNSHFLMRVYLPPLARFAQRDPIDVQGGLNVYVIAGNDPINGRDPLGLTGWALYGTPRGPGSEYDPSTNPFHGDKSAFGNFARGVVEPLTFAWDMQWNTLSAVTGWNTGTSLSLSFQKNGLLDRVEATSDAQRAMGVGEWENWYVSGFSAVAGVLGVENFQNVRTGNKIVFEGNQLVGVAPANRTDEVIFGGFKVAGVWGAGLGARGFVTSAVTATERGAARGLSKSFNTVNDFRSIAAARLAIAKQEYGQGKVFAMSMPARTFQSSDPLVAQLANKIESIYPGHVVGVNVPLRDATGNLITDVDILLRNAAIQVKSGQSAQRLLIQLQRTEAGTNLPSIGFGPNLPPNSLGTLSRQGALVTGDENLLISIIKP